MAIAVIPARGGSKRIPQKNIKLIDGQPVIARAIDILKKAEIFDQIIVSTDNSKIKKIAADAGALAPFTRPKNLSGDHATTIAVIKHAISALELKPETPVCCFYPTAVLLHPKHVRLSFELCKASHNDFIFSAQYFSHPIERAMLLDESNKITQVEQKESLSQRTQDYMPRVHDAGQFYWALASTWLAGTTILGMGSQAYLLGATEALDVDTPSDWELLEAIYQIRSQ